MKTLKEISEDLDVVNERIKQYVNLEEAIGISFAGLINALVNGIYYYTPTGTIHNGCPHLLFVENELYFIFYDFDFGNGEHIYLKVKEDKDLLWSFEKEKLKDEETEELQSESGQE